MNPKSRSSASQSLLMLARAMLLNFVRDKTALFFTFFFPLMFLAVFGLLLNDSSSSKTTLAVVGQGELIDQLPTEVLEIKRYQSFDQALEAVQEGDVPAVARQEGPRLILRYSATDQVQAATLRGILESVIAQENIQASGKPAELSLTASQVEDKTLPAIQFITGGILSWGVATSAVFGATLTLVSWRKKQLLRRVRLSPAPVWTIVAARIGVSLLVAGAQAVLYFAVALTPPFGLKLNSQSWLVIPLLACGTLAFLSIGLLVGSIAKTEESGNALANFVVLPMAFLSGTFFNMSSAPQWLQFTSSLLPLRHLSDGMAGVLARGQGAGSIVVPCLILLGFALVLTWISTRVFNWDSE
ncbi:MAG: ABC transporter permease [Angustibacter sp.]